jgi:hypothetical protein
MAAQSARPVKRSLFLDRRFDVLAFGPAASWPRGFTLSFQRTPGDGTSGPIHSVSGFVFVSGLSLRFRGEGVQYAEGIRW